MKWVKGKGKVFIAVFLLAAFWVWLFYFAPLARYQNTVRAMYASAKTLVGETRLGRLVVDPPKLPHVTLIGNQESCHGTPPEHGHRYVFSEKQLYAKQNASLSVNNEHLYPVWIMLYNVGSLDVATSLYIGSGQSGKFQLPAGEYEFEIQSGLAWCNEVAGFEEPAYLEPGTTISIAQHQTEHLRLSSFGSAPADMMVFTGQAAVNGSARQNVQGSGTLLLQPVVGGGYAVHGSINQLPVFFLVDTGATSVSIPYDFAMHAGIDTCKRVKSRTAGGTTDACIALAKEMTVGHFVFKNVEVTYSKKMPEDTFLLGMNILSQFKMVQHKDQMTLSR